MKVNKKEEVITFKVDEKLSKAMNGITNRSDFIRTAIFNALNNQCPLCKGAGVLTTDQKRHWNNFKEHHSIEECNRCNSFYLVCRA